MAYRLIKIDGQYDSSIPTSELTDFYLEGVVCAVIDTDIAPDPDNGLDGLFITTISPVEPGIQNYFVSTGDYLTVSGKGQLVSEEEESRNLEEFLISADDFGEGTLTAQIQLWQPPYLGWIYEVDTDIADYTPDPRLYFTVISNRNFISYKVDTANRVLQIKNTNGFPLKVYKKSDDIDELVSEFRHYYSQLPTTNPNYSEWDEELPVNKGETYYIQSTVYFANKYEFQTSDIIIPQLSPTTYTVTLKDGTTTIRTISVTSGGYITRPAAPQKEGYSFVGWFTSPTSTTEFDFTRPIVKDTTIYAKYTQIIVTVKFITDIANNTVYKEVQVPYGTKVDRPTDPNKTDYAFAGWYSDTTLIIEWDFNTVITASAADNYVKNLYAKWTNEYSITFNSNGGSYVSPQQIKAGEKAIKPADPTQAGYDFLGWYQDSTLSTLFDWNTPINTSYVLWAGWEKRVVDPPLVYYVTFDVNGGSPEPDPNPQPVNAGECAIKPTPEPQKDGYYFAGWIKPPFVTNFNFSTPITQDITLKATWGSTIEYYTVSFVTNGGTPAEISSQRVIQYGHVDETKIPDLTKEGYTFAGWYTTSTFASNSGPIDLKTFTVIRPTTFYAKWLQNGETPSPDQPTAPSEPTITNGYTIVFDSNGGSPVNPIIVKENSKANKPTNPTKDNYVFAYWYETDEWEAFDWETNITQNIKLYAKWERAEFILPEKTAIIIPSKNIYTIDNQKVINNRIDKIELPIQTPSLVRETTTIYTEQVNDVAYSKGDYQYGVRFKHNIGTQQDILLAYMDVIPYYTSQRFIVPKKGDGFIATELLTGKDENEQSNITYTLTGKLIKGESHLQYTIVKNDLLAGYLITLDNVSLPTDLKSESTEYSLSTTLSVTNTQEIDGEEAEVTAEIELNDKSTIKTALVTEETPNNFIIDLVILTGLKINKVKDYRAVGASYPQVFNAIGDYEEYVPTQITINFKGNVIKLDLQENTLQLGNGQNVRSFYGNELMQSSNDVSIEHEYKKIIRQYKKGKEVATLRCSLSEYYDGANNKMLSVADSTKPLLFNIGDIVEPYVYGSNKKDKPMSLTPQGSAKQFEVLEVQPSYDGGIWQTITIQEYAQDAFQAIVKIGSILSSYDDNAFVELFVLSGTLLEGDKIFYNNDSADIGEYNEEYGYYECRLYLKGAIYKSNGQGIIVKII